MQLFYGKYSKNAVNIQQKRRLKFILRQRFKNYNSTTSAEVDCRINQRLGSHV